MVASESAAVAASRPRRALSLAPPLTVAICLDHASVTGGQSMVAFDSARGLKAAGHRPIVFAAAGPVDPSLEAAGVEVVCLGQHDILDNPSRARAAIQGLWNRPAARALAGLLANLPRERTLVHVHGWAKALSPAIAVPIARSGLPAVATLHEYFQFCPNGGFFDYPAGRPCAREPMSFACVTCNCDSRSYAQKLWRCARHVGMRQIADLPAVFDDYILISKFQREIVAARLPAAARLHEVSNPIDAADLGAKSEPASGDVVFVGRIASEKGPLLFAEAARRAGLAPVFIGDGPIAGQLAAAYPEARILGWKPKTEVLARMRAARALVFPSLWYEGQPLTVMEAKAMGTPVVVSDGCAGREEIEDGVAGLWFANGQPEALARALGRLKDDALTAKLSAGAYHAYWSNPPTLKRHVQAILGVYEQALTRCAA
jgi:glycosyltransferase involved in cell wall biosynthesis